MLTPEQQYILQTKWLDWYIDNTIKQQQMSETKKGQKLLQYLLNLKWEN